MLASWCSYQRSELISQKLAQWVEAPDVELAFIQPDKPSQNAYVERSDRTFREDMLDAYLLTSLQEACNITEENGSKSTMPCALMKHWAIWHLINMRL